MPQPKKSSAKTPDNEPKPFEPRPLVMTIAGEEFAFTTLVEIDGMKIQAPTFGWLDQLTFREQLEVRRIARDLSGNATGEPPDFAPMDVAPALLTVINQRTDDTFTLDDALAMDWAKVEGQPVDGGEAS